MCACVCVYVCVQALTERGRLDSLSFLTLLLAFHCCAANDASIHSPNTPFITIRPLLFLSLLISASLSVSLFLCMPHARCTKYELSLLYIFSFACQAHLRHGGAAAAAPSSAGLDCAVIRMTAKNNKKKKHEKLRKKNGKKKYKLWQMGANFNEIQQRKANKVNEEQARQRKEKRQHTLSHPHTHSLTHTARCQQRNIKKALTAKQG